MPRTPDASRLPEIRTWLESVRSARALTLRTATWIGRQHRAGVRCFPYGQRVHRWPALQQRPARRHPR